MSRHVVSRHAEIQDPGTPFSGLYETDYVSRCDPTRQPQWPRRKSEVCQDNVVITLAPKAKQHTQPLQVNAKIALSGRATVLRLGICVDIVEIGVTQKYGSVV